MPPNHVRMWIEHHGWKVTSAGDAANVFSYSVSARSGFFMCDLCNQYLTFTRESEKVRRHFRHSSTEQDKECEDRSKYLSTINIPLEKDSRGLPLRIKFTPSGGFDLELGFMLLPDVFQHSLEGYTLVIAPVGYKYSLLERLNEGTINYLSVGNNPQSCYELSIIPENKYLADLWPSAVEGISEDGTLFDSRTCKKIPYEANIIADHMYYLLTRIEPEKCWDVKTIPKCRFNGWFVYELYPSLTKEAARFMWKNYHCWLSENTADIIPIWPPHIRTPYLLKYDKEYNRPLCFFLRGDETVKAEAYPYAHVSVNGKVFYVSANSRQQLLAAGRTKILRYMYLWKDEASLAIKTPLPRVMVTDSEGREISSGESSHLPFGKSLAVKPPFDGYALVMDGQNIIMRYALKSGIRTRIDGLRLGYSVKIAQGMDIVWQVEYKRPVHDTASKDRKLLHSLEACGGERVTAPHSMGALAMKMNDYPQTKMWLVRCIRNGQIADKAYKILVKHFACRRYQ